MSLEAAVKFAGQVAGSDALRAQIEKDTEGKDEKAALAAVVAAGKANGLDFTAEEAVQARNGVVMYLKQQTGEELTEEELAQVSGGFVNFKGILDKIDNHFYAAYASPSSPSLNSKAIMPAGNALTSAANTVASGVTSAAKTVANAFSSW